MEKTKISDKIIDNRFKISGILIILLGIIGFFLQKQDILTWILTTDKKFCLWWNLKFFLLMLVNYDLLMYITNKNKKLSLIASIIISFSGIVQWNLNNIDSLVIGELIIVLINKFFETDKKKICSLGIIISFIIYTFTFRPYVIGFGYVFIALIIWSIIKNKSKIKENLKLELITIIISLIEIIISVIFFDNNNVEYVEMTTNGLTVLFSYLYNFLLPFYNLESPEIFANIIAIFPLPLFISLYYLYQKENHVEFLLPITIVMVFETIFCMSGFPDIINKVFLFSQTNVFRVAQALQLANLYIIFYFLGNIKEELFEIKHSMRITIVLACLILFIPIPEIFAVKKFLYIFVIEITLFSFLFLNYTDPKYKKVLLFFMTLFTLIGGVPVIFL